VTDSFSVLIDVDGAGAHPGAWRLEPAGLAELLSARYVTRAVRAAERAGFSAVTFEDHPLTATQTDGFTTRTDAVLRASLNAPLTSSIGLIPVVHAIYNEPFHVATQLATLDTASLGRAGWIAEADADAAIAASYGREPLAAELAGEELSDVVTTVRRLWDSWEDDAVIRDVETGRYLDRQKLHYADVVAHRFFVKGPSIIPRSPQGQPPVFAAAGTAAEIDAALLDAPIAEAGGLVDAVSDAVGTARSWHGERTKVLLQLEVVLDRAGQSGAERLQTLDARTPWGGTHRARYVGTARGLAELLTSLAVLVDGVRIFPAVLDADLEEIGRVVLPILRDSRVFTSPRAGSTLQDNLGLTRPDNLFVEAAQ
jgi:alkanesulfonate monooxygenase SsuD/methylene tetrahydromethanopterin reductase-like flavin-dependent oxidoreductase (luciferase family)